MPGNIKGVTITFTGDTTKLEKSLRDVSKETKKIDNELRQVNNALKFNPGNVELLRQKYDLLQKKIGETTKKLGMLKDQQKAMDDAGVDKNSEEYRKLQREIIKTESQLKELNKEQQKVRIEMSKMGQASASFKKLGDSLTSAGQAMRGLSIAGAAVVTMLGTLAYKAAQSADQMRSMSKVYGISTDNLQKYALTAGLVDVDITTITKSHVKLEKSMFSAAKGSKATAGYFDQLGVSIYDANGNLRDSEDVFNDVIKALGGVENETERDAIAMSLLGKSAMELNPLIEDAGKTYTEMAEMMEKYGLDFVDEETLANANEFYDSIDRIKMLGTLAYQTLGAKLAEYLAPALEKVVDWIGKLVSWLSQLDPRVLTIIGAIGGVLAVAAPLLIGLGKVAFAISSIMGLMAALGPAIGGIVAALGPVVLAIGAVIAIGVLLYKNWDTIKAKAQELFVKIKEKFNAIKTAVTNAINSVKTFLSNVWSSIVSTATARFNALKQAITHPIETAKNLIQTAWNKIKSILGGKISLPHIKLPHFKITGKFSLKDLTVPHLSVDWYKTGGIFNSPSVIGVGEAGSEAVVPLNELWARMDKIAAAAGSGGGTTINVYASPGMDINGLARAVEQRLVQLQKQREAAWQ